MNRVRSIDVDHSIALSLGFPKKEYRAVERERRWLCRGIPRERVLQTENITDLYIAGTRLRLRQAFPSRGSPVFKLSRKADVDSHTRLITTIYLTEDEFIILTALPGKRIKKVRHRLHPVATASLLVDEFRGELCGLILAEAEFKALDHLAAFQMPEFAYREVTSDRCFTGGWLAEHGLPASFNGPI